MLGLHTELVLHICTFFPRPDDILYLSSTCTNLSVILRHRFPYLQNIFLAGWDVQAIARRSCAGDGNDWLVCARSAIDRSVVLQTFELDITVRLHPTCGPAESTKSFQTGNQFLRRVTNLLTEHDRLSIARLPYTIFDSISKVHTDDLQLFYLQCFSLAAYIRYEMINSPARRFEATSNAMQNVATLLLRFSASQWLVPFRKPRHKPAVWAHLRSAAYAHLIYTQLHLSLNWSGCVLTQMLPTCTIPSIVFDQRQEGSLLGWTTCIAARWHRQDTAISVTGIESFNGSTRAILEDVPTRALIRFCGGKGVFVGTGEDSAGSFKMEGRMTSGTVSFVKNYQDQSGEWQYYGMLLPWGWVGHWFPRGVPLDVRGDFYFWLDQDS